jgi:hypothetical protein
MLAFIVELAQPALEQRPGLIDSVGNPWHPCKSSQSK